MAENFESNWCIKAALSLPLCCIASTVIFVYCGMELLSKDFVTLKKMLGNWKLCYFLCELGFVSFVLDLWQRWNSW